MDKTKTEQMPPKKARGATPETVQRAMPEKAGGPGRVGHPPAAKAGSPVGQPGRAEMAKAMQQQAGNTRAAGLAE